MWTPENVAKVDSLISPDQSLTIDKVAIECGLSHITIHTIIHEDLGLSNLSACSVPRLLTDDHKRHGVHDQEEDKVVAPCTLFSGFSSM